MFKSHCPRCICNIQSDLLHQYLEIQLKMVSIVQLYRCNVTKNTLSLWVVFIFVGFLFFFLVLGAFLFYTDEKLRPKEITYSRSHRMAAAAMRTKHASLKSPIQGHNHRTAFFWRNRKSLRQEGKEVHILLLPFSFNKYHSKWYLLIQISSDFKKM